LPDLSKGRLVLEAHDLPAVLPEELAPPVELLEQHVDVIYSDLDMAAKSANDPTAFWNEYGKAFWRVVDDFIGSNRTWTKVVGEIVQPGDSQEVRLRKIYARVQRLRHVPAGGEWTDEEIKENKAHPIRRATDVWSQQRGNSAQLNWLFLGLLRAADVPADLLVAPRRDTQFFNVKLMNPRDLLTPIITVKLDGKDVFLDPGTRHLPFGALQWVNTGQDALLAGRDGGRFVPIPAGGIEDARIERHAVLKYSSDNVLQGTVEVSYSGREALWRRARERGEDAAARRTFLENELVSAIPVACTVKLLNEPDWEGPDAPLVAKLSVSVSGWTQPAGSRTLFPVGLLSNGQRKIFLTSHRTQPIYFRYPYVVQDDVQVQLPEGWQVQSVPKATDTGKVLRYQASASAEAGSLHLTRQLSVGALWLGVNTYSTVKTFFDSVRAADEDRAVMAASVPTGR
jgi:hypothetical protein